MHAHRRVGSKIASAATQGVESLLDRAFDKRTWQLYCALYAVRSTTRRVPRLSYEDSEAVPNNASAGSCCRIDILVRESQLCCLYISS